MNKNNPKISVVIPIYNVADYLPKCLDSVLGQTYKNIEIIAVNDGSPDNCLQILEDYAKKDSRIKIISQKNQGVSAARNAGLDAATGDYVSMPDPDDYLALGCYKKFVNILQREKRTIDVYVFNGLIEYLGETMQISAISKMLPIQDWGDFSKSHFKDWRKHKKLVMGDMSICNKIFRHDFIKKYHLRFLEGFICEDKFFGAQAQLLTKNIYVVEDYMYLYQQTTTSVSCNLGDNILDCLVVSDKMEELYKKHRFYKQAIGRHFKYLTQETQRFLPKVSLELAEKFIQGARSRLQRMYHQIADKSEIEQKYIDAYQDILNMNAQSFIAKYANVLW